MLPLLILLLAPGVDPSPAARITPNAAPSPPTEIHAALDSLVTLPGTGTWTLATELPCRFWPKPDGTCEMSALSLPGRYIVHKTSGGELTRYVVVFEGGQPMPPAPVPVPPAPVPPTPVPVPPVPVPPAPVDPLKAKLEAAFAADAAPLAQKKADVKELVALYGAGADGCCLGAMDDAGKPILDKDGKPTFVYTTPKQLLDAVRKVGNGKIGDRLHNLRVVFQAELQALLKSTNDPFTDATRTATADLFKRAETILETLGK